MPNDKDHLNEKAKKEAILAKDKEFLNSLSASFGDNPHFISLENGQIDRDSMSVRMDSLNNSFYINRADGDDKSWVRYERDEDGNFQEKSLTDEEKEKIDSFYQMRTNQANQDKVKEIASAQIRQIRATNGSRIPYEFDKNNPDNPDNTDDVILSNKEAFIWTYLLSHGDFYYESKEPTENREHYHKIKLENTLLTDTPMDSDQFYYEIDRNLKNEVDAYYDARQENSETERGIVRELLYAQRYQPGRSAEKIFNRINNLRETLKDNSRSGHSSKEYKRVEKALENYLALDADAKMTASERRAMLYSIASLAATWIDNRDAKEQDSDYRNRSVYHDNRARAMLQVYNEAIMMANAINVMSELGSPMTDHIVKDTIPAEERNWDLNAADSERYLQTARRSMRGRKFSASSFAMWKAMTLLTSGKKSSHIHISQEERNKKIGEILNSPAIALIGNFNSSVNNEYNKDEDDKEMKDEYEADRVYAAAQEAADLLKIIKTCNTETFITNYKDLVQNTNKDLISGNAAFDKYIHQYLLNEFKLQAYARDIEMEKDGTIISSDAGPALTNKYRQMMMLTLFYNAPEEPALNVKGHEEAEQASQQADLEELSSAAKESNDLAYEVKDEMAFSLFNMNYQAIGELFGNNIASKYSLRSTTGVIMIAAMLADGLTFDQIFNPDSEKEKKRELGNRILSDFEKPEEERNFSKTKIDRMVIDHAEEMHNYLLALSKQLNIKDSRSVALFTRKTSFIYDGLFDLVGQQMNVKQMLKEDKDRFLATFGHENEKPEDTIKRVKKIEAGINFTQTFTLCKKKLLNNYADLEKALKVQHISEKEIMLIQTATCNIFQNKITDPAFASLPLPQNDKEAAGYITSTRNVGMYLSQELYNHVLSYCSGYERLLLATDDTLAGMIKVSYKPEAIKEYTPEKAIKMCMDHSFDQLADITLSLMNGKEKLTLTQNMLAGKDLTYQQKAFMDKFRSELKAYSKQKQENGYAALKENFTALVRRALPARLQNYQPLFNEYPYEMQELYETFRYADTSNIREGFYAKEQADPVKYVVIGDKTAEDVIRQITDSLQIDYGKLNQESKTLMLTLASTAALRHGQAVTIVGADISRTTGNNNDRITQIRLPGALAGNPSDQKVKNILSSLWEKQKSLHTAYKRPTKSQIKNLSQKHLDSVNKVNARMKRNIDARSNSLNDINETNYQQAERNYIDQNQWECRDFILNRENTKKIIGSRDSLRKEVLDLLILPGNIGPGEKQPDAYQKAADVPAYKFANGMTIDPAAMIMAIAYKTLADSKAEVNGRPFDYGSKITMPFDNAVKAELTKAAEEYKKILELGKTAPEQADDQMRIHIANAASRLYSYRDNEAENAMPGQDEAGQKKADIQNAAGSEKKPYEELIGREQANAGDIFMKACLFRFMEKDRGTVSYTDEKRQNKKSSFKALLAGHKLLSRDDFSDLIFYSAAEKMNSVYTDSKNIADDIRDVKELLGSYIYQESTKNLKAYKDHASLSELSSDLKEGTGFARQMLALNGLNEKGKHIIFGKKINKDLAAINDLLSNPAETLSKVYESAARAEYDKIAEKAKAVAEKEKEKAEAQAEENRKKAEKDKLEKDIPIQEKVIQLNRI